MRRLVLAAVAAAALAGTMTLTGSRSEAMTLPGVIGSPATEAESVALVCRRVWNGWAWVRSCYRTGPGYYGYGRPYYGGPRRYYRRW
jgi:hypothetical protein